ncbi:hypothetical protein COOONC_17348 [Cooperia oncophora]
MARSNRRKRNSCDDGTVPVSARTDIGAAVGIGVGTNTSNGKSTDTGNGKRLSTDYNKLTVNELINSIMELNKDPVISQMLAILSEKIPKEFSDLVDKERRSRSLVIAGVMESESGLPPSARGGVCCFFKSYYCLQVVSFDNALKADVTLPDLYSAADLCRTRFILVYRPPNSVRDDDEALIDLMASLNSCDQDTLILGDFNLQIDWRNFSACDAASRSFLRFFLHSDLTQFVKKPTHLDRVLDIILTSSPIVKNVTILSPLATSDHAVIHFLVEVSLPPIHMPFPKPDFLGTDYTALSLSLDDVDWLKVFGGYSSVSDLYFRFCSIVYQKLALHVPIRYPRLVISNISYSYSESSIPKAKNF